MRVQRLTADMTENPGSLIGTHGGENAIGRRSSLPLLVEDVPCGDRAVSMEYGPPGSRSLGALHVFSWG